MTARCAVLFVRDQPAFPAAPLGVDATELRLAMITDVGEVLEALSGVDGLVAHSARQPLDVAKVISPYVPVVEVDSFGLAGALEAAGRGWGLYSEVVIVADDVPDLPPMILAKVFQALASYQVAVAPAAGGGAVALGVTLPLPAWLSSCLAEASLEMASLIDQLRLAAPRPSDIKVTPGWRRLRTSADLGTLDAGLEGWESTRALLAAATQRGNPL